MIMIQCNHEHATYKHHWSRQSLQPFCKSWPTTCIVFLENLLPKSVDWDMGSTDDWSSLNTRVNLLEGTSTYATYSGIVSHCWGLVPKAQNLIIIVLADVHLRKDLPQTVVMEISYLLLITDGSSKCSGSQPNTCSHKVYIQNVNRTYPPHSGGQAHLVLQVN